MSKLLLMLLCSASLLIPKLASANIVFNGGFELGDVTGWILSGNPVPGNVDGSSPHSGDFAANLFAATNPGFIEQVLATTPGTVYKLTYFLESDGQTPNRFLTQVNGATLFDQTDIPVQPYTLHSSSFTATGASTDLKFGFRNDPGMLRLDDIAVDAIPEPSVIGFLIVLALLIFATRTARAMRIAKHYVPRPAMNKRIGRVMLSLVCLPLAVAATLAQATTPTSRPNILFIIMDDVGIDQMRSFGYGGVTPPATPVLDVVAQHGIRFRNTWGMPECSPSRAMFFEGRYPLRTNIFTAILTIDLANSQVSPFEITTPKILKNANYTSALFGKFHLAGPTNNPYGNGTPNSVGFDYFDGFLEGAPHPIDTTAGGVGRTGGSDAFPTGIYGCGFVPGRNDDPAHGSDKGACYFADQRACKIIEASSSVPAPGRLCLEQGGVFVPAKPEDDKCHATAPSEVNFNLANGYYVFNLVTNDLQAGTVYKHPLIDPRARTYSPIETTNAAVSWINSRPSGQRWMATVSYATIHAPYQQAPQSLTPSTSDLSGVQCTGGTAEDTRTLSNQMLEAMDSQIGRLLVETGVASRQPDGSLQYDPTRSNTMVVIIGDNGTYSPSVKAPFDPTHAKGFVNQTGVWIPLLVAGPLVNTPDRNVEHMINVADLFQLFGEIAGLDVRALVPSSRILDSVSMLPYLTNPAQASLRTYNFTQTGNNISAHGERPQPCVISVPPQGPALVNTCVQIFPQMALCIAEGGVWYGDGTTVSPKPFNTCCELQQANLINNLNLLPVTQQAVRNDHFKLIQVTNQVCTTDPPQEETTVQFYRIDEAPIAPLIDLTSLNLITSQSDPTSGLGPDEKTAFLVLRQQLTSILTSEAQCPGDGNYDGVVDQLDVDNWNLFHKSGSSWYDINLPSTNGYDGQTNQADLQFILQNLGTKCPPR